MNAIQIVAVLLAVVMLARPLLRIGIALFAGKAIGARALANVPDTVHLEPAGSGAWRDEPAVRALAEPLLAAGFADAGTYTVREMPGFVLRLLAEPREGVLAIVHEHPVAGRWLELAVRYTDGSSLAVSTRPGTGLAHRPGHVSHHLPGADPAAAWRRLQSARGEGATRPLDARGAAAAFEEGYAEAVRWRKAHGVSRAEVVKVAARRAA